LGLRILFENIAFRPQGIIGVQLPGLADHARIPISTCDGSELCFIHVENIKIKEMVLRRPLAKAHTVCKLFDFRQNGIDGSFDKLFHAITL